MARQKKASSGDSGGGGDSGRDLVRLYSRLTHTLEIACGGERLAEKLNGLRGTPAREEEIHSALPALVRAFRRLGLTAPGDGTEASARELSARMGEAVSRPADHLISLWMLFARGDPSIGLKAICGATPQCRACRITRECEYFNNPRKPEAALLTPAARLSAGHEMALSDAELLAVLLFGEKGDGREEVVATLLARYGRLRAIFRAEPHEYRGIRDMGRPQALRLTAMAALRRRLMAELRDEVLHIASARDIHDRYAAELCEFPAEAAVLLLLDRQNNVMRDVWFRDGSPNMAHVGIADLLRPAVREFAPRIALIRNHPSNNASPSAGERDFTRRLRAACDLMDIALVDHVIVCEKGYFSFADVGMPGS